MYIGHFTFLEQFASNFLMQNREVSDLALCTLDKLFEFVLVALHENF